MATNNTPVSIINNTGELLYLCVQVSGEFQEWSLPNGGSQTINADTTQVLFLQTESGQGQCANCAS